MTSLPTITEAARTYLNGRPLVLRASRRHGCCGSTAFVPVAETTAPRDLDEYEVVSDGDVTLYIERCLGEVGDWTVDAAGLWRWQKLLIEGAANLPPDIHDDGCPAQDT